MRQYVLEKCHSLTNVGLGGADKIQKSSSKTELFITRKQWSNSEQKVIIISKADLGHVCITFTVLERMLQKTLVMLKVAFIPSP